jgi:xanthine/uracil/vitamin C permease (AzgA family)
MMPLKKRICCSAMAFVICSSIAVLGNVVLIGKNLKVGIPEALATGIGAGIAAFYLLSRNTKKR